MKIEHIEIKNFRAFKAEGLSFPFYYNTLLGENNTGKSSIFEAIKVLLTTDLQQPINWKSEYWHKGRIDNQISIELTINLDNSQIQELKQLLQLRISNEIFKDIFSSELVYKFQTQEYGVQPYSSFSLGYLSIINHLGYFFYPRITPKVPKTEESKIKSWQEISGNINTEDPIYFLYRSLLDPPEPFRINFEFNISLGMQNVLKENIVFIDEFRDRPHEQYVESLTSPTGSDLASLLFNLKNSSKGDLRIKYGKIQQIFKKMFPNLSLEVTKEREGDKDIIKISVQKGRFESTTQYIGAGILQYLNIITHLIIQDEKLLLIDQPEQQLHPHPQRTLSNLLSDQKGTQSIIITHSPYFVNLNRNSSIFRFIQEQGGTKIITPPLKYFKNDDYDKLDQFLDNNVKELFFARKVILVEGQTEVGSLPIFSKYFNYNFDPNGISLIDVGGNKNFRIFVRVCKAFKVPYFVIADSDAKTELQKMYARRELFKYQSHILTVGEFEDLFPDDLQKEAIARFKRSKPRKRSLYGNGNAKKKFINSK